MVATGLTVRIPLECCLIQSNISPNFGDELNFFTCKESLNRVCLAVKKALLPHENTSVLKIRAAFTHNEIQPDIITYTCVPAARHAGILPPPREQNS